MSFSWACPYEDYEKPLMIKLPKKKNEDLNIKDTIIEYRKLWGCVKDENGIQIF